MKVYSAIAAVMADLAREGITKDRKNQSQGFMFRGVDDVYNTLAPLLVKNGLLVLPSYEERTEREAQTKSGGTLGYVTVKGRFAFTAVEDGSTVQIVTYGEAMDSGDKATNKAMSIAFKYAMFQAFCIPTEADNDADAHTHQARPVVKTTSTGEVVKKLPAWTDDQKLEIGAIRQEIMELGGDKQYADMQVKMKYDAPADVIDAATQLVVTLRNTKE